MTENLNSLLKDARQGREEASAWIPFFEGFEVRLAYLSRSDLQAIVRKSRRRTWDERHQPVDEIQEELLAKNLCPYILDWRGLTPDVLARLLPLDRAKLDFDELPCMDENKITMIREVYGFADFIQENLTSFARINEARVEEVRKNSTTSHSPE